MKIQALFLSAVFSMIPAAYATAGGSGAKIRSDYDHAANFATYKTFGFVKPPGTEVDGYPVEVTQGIKAAAQHELEKRGYRYTDSHPDLLINFSARLENVAKTNDLAAQHIGYYGYRNVAVYKTWASYRYDKGVDKYTDGTVNVDVVDAQAGSLVWEGVAIGKVKAKELDLQAAIDRVVAEIFAKYPFRAKP